MNDKPNHQDRDGDLVPKEIASAQSNDTRMVRPPGLPNAGIFEALLPHARYQTYLARKAILREGETPAAIYFVLRGSVSVMMQDEDGHELILAYLRRTRFVRQCRKAQRPGHYTHPHRGGGHQLYAVS
jgi:Cyclic nucleotide-binding domain